MKPYHERITDSKFRVAVDLIDEGEIENLEKYLVQNPEVVHQRVLFDEKGYFSNPGLLEFIAENPVRHGKLPQNIVEIARVILEAGAKKNQQQIDYTLGLVSSGKVVRECNLQIPLINLLCNYGADPDQATLPALAHGEFEATEALVKNGAKINLPLAAATGRLADFENLFILSNPTERHLAVAFAAQHGRAEILKILLQNGLRSDRYNPKGAHDHSTPLHQAVISGNLEIVKLLVASGMRLDLKDKIYHGTALDWAVYGKFTEIENYLRTVENI
ncbi:ankyrin repeat domain-containing protein [Dyadobacter sp. 3J3]|uniref:ankyrin repeat domain-containing protein n=1 Tax=Dyadobacter sp. 3J3 TaxID=2606600 RepID=UPI001357F383|nr:ankyrin repeat domain-containing protein [Dyadobacter sp. 3J3]